jgi:hypothetical protein
MLSEPPGADRHAGWCGGRRGELGAYPMYARHDQRLGGESPLWRLMAPTTSQGQLRRREAGWEGSRRRNRDPRNTWPIAAMAAVGCAYEARRSGRASIAWRSPMSIKGPLCRRGGCAGKAVGLIRGGLCGCPRMPRHAWRVRGVVRDGRGREAAARRRAISRGRSTSGIDGRWEGPNAKPSVRTFVLVVVAVIAANPFGGLAGRVQR